MHEMLYVCIPELSKKEVKLAVDGCRQAGIRVAVINGDNKAQNW
jgi:magnesium-transporting ATPase (P-type)